MAVRRPSGKKPTSRYWIPDAKDKTRVKCLKSSINDCYVIRLWQASRSGFHDAALQQATTDINRILQRVDRENADPSRHASFIKVDGRLMLVWAQHDSAVASSDAEATVARALKVRRSSTH